MIYSVDGRGGMGNGVPIYRRGNPGALEYIDHRGGGTESSREKRREKADREREKEKKISKIQQEPDTNTDYSR